MARDPPIMIVDDNDLDVDEPETTLDTIDKSKTITLPIRAKYTNWDPREAFRELLQNWYVLHPDVTGYSHHLDI